MGGQCAIPKYNRIDPSFYTFTHLTPCQTNIAVALLHARVCYIISISITFCMYERSIIITIGVVANNTFELVYSTSLDNMYLCKIRNLIGLSTVKPLPLYIPLSLRFSLRQFTQSCIYQSIHIYDYLVQSRFPMC